jgi:hypothetical protein
VTNIPVSDNVVVDMFKIRNEKISDVINPAKQEQVQTDFTPVVDSRKDIYIANNTNKDGSLNDR